MEKYTEYRIVRAHSLDKLEIEVAGQLDTGWIPTGGVTHILADKEEDLCELYVQAMIR